MALLTKRPKGTQDFLPDRTGKLQYLESTLLALPNCMVLGRSAPHGI